MRQFIRHPSTFPVELAAESEDRGRRECMHDVSVGGLCCRCDEPFAVGERVRLRIPVGRGFETSGRIAWCRAEDEGYRVGITFLTPEDAFGVRLVEQVCHIQRYRDDVLAREGRQLDEEQAAHEWIAGQAAAFPQTDSSS